MKNWKESTGVGVSIIVIDSGIDLKHQSISNYSFRGYSVGVSENRDYTICPGFKDEIGHGTAIVSIIKKLSPYSDITIIKAFDNDLNIEYEKLFFILDYIKNNMKCDILHLSLGINMCDNLNQFRTVCEDIKNQGTIIVSAYDNLGSISYPAAFSSVIGVDGSEDCKSEFDYEYVCDSKINIRGKAGSQRLAWLDGKYIINAGNSYAAAYITAIISKIIESNNKDNLNKILKQYARKIHDNKSLLSDNLSFHPNEIKSAVIFPFNKELHTLLLNQDLLSFSIHSIYNVKYSGQINQFASKLLQTPLDNDFLIKNYQQINWEEDFDTVILGHVDVLDSKLNIDLKEHFLEKCRKYKKNIYSFDKIISNYESIYFPEITEKNIIKNTFGKLQLINKPIIGIFGTSSFQGKFTLQLSLRRLFINNGYTVGQLGTEPQSLLFSFNEVYPMGYNSAVKVNGYNAINLLNQMMGKIEMSDPDVIIVGSQSGTIPYINNNLKFFTIPQIEFLLGTQPDRIVLCINIDEEIDYLKRTIQVIEGLSHGTVCCIAVFPFQKNYSFWNRMTTKKNTHDECKEYSSYIERMTNVPTYIQQYEDDLIYSEIIQHLT